MLPMNTNMIQCTIYVLFEQPFKVVNCCSICELFGSLKAQILYLMNWLATLQSFGMLEQNYDLMEQALAGASFVESGELVSQDPGGKVLGNPKKGRAV